MMTSSNGNFFRVTGPLCGESTGSRWIPSTRASDAELWCFFDLRMKNGWVNNRDAGYFRRHRAHYDVTVIYHNERSRKHILALRYYGFNWRKIFFADCTHNSDTKWVACCLKSLVTRLFVQQVQKNITKLALCDDRWIPSTKGQWWDSLHKRSVMLKKFPCYGVMTDS